MNKIATRQYVSNLGGGMVIDNKCATSQWINDNYPDVEIVGTYESSRLVKEEDLDSKKLCR